MTLSLVQSAAARAAVLRAELAQLAGVEELANQAAVIRRVATVLQINNTTIAAGPAGGANFDIHITDQDLVTRVRALIADDREAKAVAMIGGAPVSPQSPTEPQKSPAPEVPAVRPVAAVASTPTPEPTADALTNAREAGAEHCGRNGERKNPYRGNTGLAAAWIEGYDKSAAGAASGARSAAFMAGRDAFACGKFGSVAEAEAALTEGMNVAEFHDGWNQTEKLTADEPQFVKPVPTPTPADDENPWPESKPTPAVVTAAPKPAAPTTPKKKGLF